MNDFLSLGDWSKLGPTCCFGEIFRTELSSGNEHQSHSRVTSSMAIWSEIRTFFSVSNISKLGRIADLFSIPKKVVRLKGTCSNDLMRRFGSRDLFSNGATIVFDSKDRELLTRFGSLGLGTSFKEIERRAPDAMRVSMHAGTDEFWSRNNGADPSGGSITSRVICSELPYSTSKTDNAALTTVRRNNSHTTHSDSSRISDARNEILVSEDPTITNAHETRILYRDQC